MAEMEGITEEQANETCAACGHERGYHNFYCEQDVEGYEPVMFAPDNEPIYESFPCMCPEFKENPQPKGDGE